jgi:hypothetical protein
MAQRPSSPEAITRSINAGVLGWFIPGAGHWVLGHRKMGTLFFLAITLPYLTGVAIGGVKTTINPFLNHWLFLAEMGVGGYTGAFFLMNNAVGPYNARESARIINQEPWFSAQSPEKRRALQDQLHPYVSYYPTSEVGQIYVAVAGLLNILAVLDAITRAQTGGKPVFSPEWSQPPPEDI